MHALKQKPNDLLIAHGPMGSLLIRLQRFSLLGWALFIFLLVIDIAVVTIDQIIPDPVIAVDASGRVLGTFEFMDATVRSESEILAGAQHFVRNYVNVNSATIFEDYSDAVNMMTPALAKATLADVRRTGYLTAIKEADTQSRVTFLKDKEKPQILRRKGLEATIWLRGNIVVRYQNQMERLTPFDFTIDLRLVPRTTLSTQGLQVIKIKEKEIQ